jgi:hypothetical protein
MACVVILGAGLRLGFLPFFRVKKSAGISSFFTNLGLLIGLQSVKVEIITKSTCGAMLFLPKASSSSRFIQKIKKSSFSLRFHACECSNPYRRNGALDVSIRG